MRPKLASGTRSRGFFLDEGKLKIKVVENLKKSTGSSSFWEDSFSSGTKNMGLPRNKRQHSRLHSLLGPEPCQPRWSPSPEAGPKDRPGDRSPS